jgi:hypothetical protein
VNSSKFHNWTKCIIIGNSIAFLETFSHYMSLVLINRTISFVFDFMDPLTIDEVAARSRRNKMPSFVVYKC